MSRTRELFRIRSQLAKFQPSPMDTEAVKEAGWRELDTLVIHVNDRELTDAERSVIEGIGNRKYGARYGR